MANVTDPFLSGRFALLTGAGRSGQTGEIIARELAQHGARVILVDRNPDNAAERSAELRRDGFDATGLVCDLVSGSDVARLAVEVERMCGERGLAALINAAGGYAASGSVAEGGFDVWRSMLDINLVTAVMATHAFLPLLRKGRGTIVNFATGAALPGQRVAGMAAYVAAKSGVITLTRAVAQEEADSGVRANAIAPSAIRTAANIDSMGANIRYVEREEVARTIAFLCSPAASAISGEVIRLA